MINLKFRATRVEKGYTQQTLAEAIGVSPITVYNWESGHTKPKPGNMIELSEKMDVPVEDIVRMFA